MEKYYTHLDYTESKNFYRVIEIKQKTGVRIKKLEDEVKCTWEDFREKLDRASMMYEDKISNEYEQYLFENLVIEECSELNIKDYNSALHKIKQLFSVKKILEKRKKKDEKIAIGLNNKINILTEKFMIWR